jgi:hypothetical protein
MKEFLGGKMPLHVMILVAALLGWSPLAAAQNTAAAVSDSDFATFVMVNVELQKLSDEYQPALNQAGEEAGKRAALEQEMQKKAEEVLAKNNLTPDAYRQIYKTVNSDQELRAKALQMIQQEREQR